MSNSKPPSSLREMELISMNFTKRVYKKMDSALSRHVNSARRERSERLREIDLSRVTARDRVERLRENDADDYHEWAVMVRLHR